MDRAAALAYAEAALPGEEALEAEALAGGSLNYVWRVHLADRSVVVKEAPPYVAATPDVERDPSRLNVEVRALQLFGPSGELRTLCDAHFRPPQVIAFSPQRYRLIMEDLGRAHDLRAALEADEGALAVVERLARFVSALHRDTRGNAELAQHFNNTAVQASRFDVQYGTVGALLEAAGVADARDLGQRAAVLGDALRLPGVCLTMGDLWPPSILVEGADARIIDWEFCHYGRPLQDVAHLVAHLWMLEHTASSAELRERFSRARSVFQSGYLDGLRDRAAPLWDERESMDASVHVGCEILARTVGSSSAGYLYAGRGNDDPLRLDAVAVAAAAIRDRSFFQPEAVN